MVNTIVPQRNTTVYDDVSRERRDGEGSGWRSWFGFGDKKEDDREYKYTRSYTGTVREPGFSTEYNPDYSYKYTDRQFPETNKYYSRDQTTTYDRQPTEYYRSETYPTYYQSTTYPTYRSYGNYTSGQQYPTRPYTQEYQPLPVTYGPEPRPYGPEPRPYTTGGYTSTTQYGPEPRPYGPERQYGYESGITRPYYGGDQCTYTPRCAPHTTCGSTTYGSGPYGRGYYNESTYPYTTPTGRGYYNESTYTSGGSSRPYGGLEFTTTRPAYGGEYMNRPLYGGETSYTYGRGF